MLDDPWKRISTDPKQRRQDKVDAVFVGCLLMIPLAAVIVKMIIWALSASTR